MYYLQSRYYNLEWGRFINADALGGCIGELLSHNAFAYCKNNPINMSDLAGFRPVYTMGEENDEMRAASLAVMNTAVSNSSSHVNGGISSDDVVEIGINTAKDLALGALGYGLDTLSEDSFVAFNRSMRRAGEYLYIPGSTVAKVAGRGIVVLDISVSLVNDIGGSNSTGEAIGKCAIDVVSAALSVAASAAFTPIVGAAVGVGLGFLGDGLKRWIW